jgi:hypothetical protein
MPTKFTPEGDHSLPVFVEAPTHISSNGIISEQGSSNVTIAEPGKEFEVQLTDEDASNPKVCFSWSPFQRLFDLCSTLLSVNRRGRISGVGISHVLAACWC